MGEGRQRDLVAVADVAVIVGELFVPHLEPHVAILTVTDPVRALADAGKEKAAVTIAAHDGDGEPVDALAFTRLRLVTYA